MQFELDLGEVIDVALYVGEFERDVVRAIDSRCRPGMTVMDIGANMGAHALRCAKLVGTSGKVYAFEPTTYAFQKLVRNLSLNDFPQARAFRIALSDQSATGKQISYRSSWRTDRRDQATSVDTVDFVKLDDWCMAQNVDHVDLVKLDVDGYEYPILRGGLALIRRCRPTFVMEAVGPHFESDDRNPYALLFGLGYRFKDTKTDCEYENPDEIRALLPAGDYAMTQSLNVIAWATN